MTSYMNRKDLTETIIPPQRREEISDAVRRAFDSIAQAAEQAGRRPSDVRLLAAVKTRNVGEIMAAVKAGVRLLGENRPQEVMAVASGLAQACREEGLDLGEQVGFHLIGQLQSNKINKILGLVSTVESVDSLELGVKLSSRAVRAGLSLDVFLEVNVSGEEAKSGCRPQEAEELAFALAQLPNLVVRGLMTVGAHVDDEAQVRSGFAHLRRIREGILSQGEAGLDSCRDLSMGMSGDYPLAIAEGATIVRLGTALFGQRAYR